MTWKDYLKAAERRELEKATGKRDAVQAELTAVRRKLQSRCEWRMRRALRKQGEQ